MSNNNVLIEVNGLKTYFYLTEGLVRAVDGVSFSIQRGQTLGVGHLQPLREEDRDDWLPRLAISVFDAPRGRRLRAGHVLENRARQHPRRACRRVP